MPARLIPLLLALVVVSVLFTGLDSIPLTDQREARDARVAREMVATHDMLTPRLAGRPHFEKPIAAYAPEALIAIDSRNPVRDSRAWRAVVALALLALVGSIGAEQFGARTGWLAALVLATTLGLPLASHTDGTQLLATCFAWLACSGFADAAFGHRRGRVARLIVSYGALAAALVVAGPLPALWPLAGVALYAALTRRGDLLQSLLPLPGALLMLGVAIPWYGAMARAHGDAFLSHVPFFPYAAEARGPWFAGPVLCVSFLVVAGFPWSTLLPGALLHAASWWRLPRVRRPPPAGDAPEPELAARLGDVRDTNTMERERREEHAAHFFIACLLAALAPILFYPGPPLPAALPALPAVALLCARQIDHLFENDVRVAAALNRGVLMLGMAGTVAAVSFAVLAGRLPDVAPDLRALAAALLLLSWAPFLANLLVHRRWAALLFVLPVTVCTPVVTLRLLPAMSDYLQTGSVADAVNAVAPAGAALVLVDPAPPSLLLTLKHSTVRAGALRETLRGARAADGHAYIAFRPLREHEIARDAQAPLEILMRTPSLVLARVPVEEAP